MAFKVVDGGASTPVPQGKKTRILMMSDSPLLHTGMGVVFREIALGLIATGKYEVIGLGWGHNGFPHNLPFQILPASSRDFGKDGHPQAGIPGFAQTVDMVKPDVVWALGDSWMLNWINDVPNRKNFKYIQYMPIDGDPVPSDWVPWIEHADKLVLYSQYGVREVAKAAPHIKPAMIYHGTHPERYFPIPPEAKAEVKSKISYWTVTGDNQVGQVAGLPADSFVIGTVARNQPRKNFDKIIKAFSVFSKDKPDVRLWLHTAVQDAAYNLPKLAYMYGCGDKVCFTPNYNLTRGLSEQDMNLLMNIFDVHLLPTQGEGFGIPILETMSCGVPQIVTDYTAHVEWCKDSSILIPVTPLDDFITGIPHPVERAIPKVTEIIKALEAMYKNKGLRETLSKNARAVAEKMTWEATIPQWDRVIQEVISGNAVPIVVDNTNVGIKI